MEAQENLAAMYVRGEGVKRDNVLGYAFLVVENRKGNISYYAMFREQPTYATLKALATGNVDGSAQPLATVHWPAGAKEPVIDAYDAKRLK